MTRHLGWTAAALAALVVTATTARADWPMARHDPHRTASASGVSNLHTPLPYWRQYLGGSLFTPHVMPVGDDDVAYVGAGRLRVLSSEGVPRWSSDNLALTFLIGSADLDGDGAAELVARSTDRVFVFDAASGALRWAEPVGEMGTIADVRIDDLDHLSGPELTVQECGCCQIVSSVPGAVYNFKDGWAAPNRLWQLPSTMCGAARQMTIADVDGDSAPDLVLAAYRTISIVDGTNGTVFATSPDLGEWASAAYCEAHDVIPGAGAELVCVMGSTLAPGRGHRVYVLQHQASPSRLVVAWETVVGDRDGDFILGAGHVVDLDGDGQLEITVTGVEASGLLVTEVLDAATGAVLATIEGQETVGAVPATPTDTIYITQASQQLLGWHFDRDAMPRLTLRWRLKDRRVLLQRDWALSPKQYFANRLVYHDVNGDGALDLYTVDTKRPDELPVYDARNPADTTLRVWKARPGSEIIAGWLDGDRLVVSSSDGRLTTIASDVTGAIGSFRAGQYYDGGGWLHLPFAPVAAQLAGDAAAEIVVPDSRRALIALDAKGATNAAPPRQLWELRSATAPSIAPGLGASGGPGLACRRLDTSTVPATDKVARVDASGVVRWEMPVGGPIFNDVLVGNFDGDAVPDLAVQWGLTTDNAVRTTALAGSDGRTLWTASTTGGDARFPAGAALADWNHDGRDDVIFHHYGTYVLSGVSGIPIATGGPGTSAYFLPMVQDVDGDGSEEISLSGSIDRARTLRHDLTTAWTGNDDRPYPYAAHASCSGRALLVSTSLANPSRLTVTEQAGAQAGVSATLVLAGGRLFADEAAADAAGAQRGQLTSVHVHANLTGAGRPSAVVGSSDGWLYAIDPCARALDFAVPFGAPVGASAFADLDGDGQDDLLVSVADGYLYGLRDAPLAGPGLVRDLDVGTGSPDDVDEITTRDTLSASWDPVPGAASYEVAFALADGGYLRTPNWTAVDATSFTQVGLPLVDGERYLVSVRALTATGGRSPDVLSDGVLVHLLPPIGEDAGVGHDDAGITPGEPDGGCCSTGARGEASVLLGLATVALIVRRRRR